jgi:GAF domain-containing protein
MAEQELLTRTLVELADTLVDDFDVVDLLTLLTDRCCEAFDISDAGIMLAAPVGGELRLMASSSAAMRDMELYELQASDGPCLDCYRSGEPVVNHAVAAAAGRWPAFAPAALAAGFRTVSAIPMRLRGRIIGALNLFRTEEAEMSDADLSGARAFADVATIAILSHQAATDARVVNEQLNRALNSRVIIEQAKGKLAERAALDVDQAFVWLRGHARRHNLRLVDLAQDFIEGRTKTIEPPTSPRAGPATGLGAASP